MNKKINRLKYREKTGGYQRVRGERMGRIGNRDEEIQSPRDEIYSTGNISVVNNVVITMLMDDNTYPSEHFIYIHKRKRKKTNIIKLGF